MNNTPPQETDTGDVPAIPPVPDTVAYAWGGMLGLLAHLGRSPVDRESETLWQDGLDHWNHAQVRQRISRLINGLAYEASETGPDNPARGALAEATATRFGLLDERVIGAFSQGMPARPSTLQPHERDAALLGLLAERERWTRNTAPRPDKAWDRLRPELDMRDFPQPVGSTLNRPWPWPGSYRVRATWRPSSRGLDVLVFGKPLSKGWSPYHSAGISLGDGGDDHGYALVLEPDPAGAVATLMRCDGRGRCHQLGTGTLPRPAGQEVTIEVDAHRVTITGETPSYGALEPVITTGDTAHRGDGGLVVLRRFAAEAHTGVTGRIAIDHPILDRTPFPALRVSGS